MNWKRFAILLTALNLVLVALVLGEVRPAVASQDVVPVLRGRALELVDARGHVRAEIKVLPALPTVKMPDGTTGFPESVQLRLIDSEGAPNVKLGASEDGSGLVLGGESGSYVQILSRGTKPFMKFHKSDSQQRLIEP